MYDKAVLGNEQDSFLPETIGTLVLIDGIARNAFYAPAVETSTPIFNVNEYEASAYFGNPVPDNAK